MRARLWAILCVIGWLPAAAFAASDYFLVLDGIPGESTDKAHPGAIVIESFSFGVSNTPTTTSTGGTAAGKPSFKEISFTKFLDKSSPLLFLHSAGGKSIKRATLYMRKVGATPFQYSVVTLTDVLVTSIQTAGHDAENLPTESFSLNFSTIEVSYTAQKADGSADVAVRFGWDVRANVGF